MARGGASRGGGGGGSRGSSGGGSRGSMGRSGGGGFSRGGVGGGSRGGSMGGMGGFGGGYRPPPPRRSGMGGFGMGYGMGRMSGGWGRGYRSYRRPFFGSGGCGCLVVPVGFIIAAMVLVIIFSIVPPGGGGSANTGGSTGEVTASTVEREPLPKGSVNETDYYTDELGWIGNSTTLTAGMKNFYNETGVQPYLYLTDTVDGSHNPSSAQMEAYANDLYDALFTDEAHLLLVFFEYDGNGDYQTWCITGTQAKSVMDTEAVNILMDYVDKYYYDSSLTDEEMFSKAFDETADRIMTVTTSPWVAVAIIVGVLAILVVVFLWWRSYKKQKNLEAEQAQKILETPLETFGDTEAEHRAKKYDE